MRGTDTLQSTVPTGHPLQHHERPAPHRLRALGYSLTLLALSAPALVACTGDDDARATSPSATSPSATAEAPSANTQAPSTAPTTAPSPRASAAPSHAASGTTTPEPRSVPLTLYYVAVDDGGKAGARIGCGDSLVAVQTAPVTFTDQIAATLKAALADHDEEHGASGLRNALAQSRLNYVSSSVAGDTVTVKLSGSLVSGGTCDTPRIEGQLEQAAATAAGTGEAVILVDGVRLEEALSTK